MSIYRLRIVGMVILSSVALLGCGGSGGPGLYPVTGTVTYKDKPVPNANIMFAPENGAPATGKTTDTGDFTLSTNGQPGAVAGKGVWTITAFEKVELPPPISSDEAGKLAEQGKPLPIVKGTSIIPEKYGVGVTSNLKYEVTTKASDNDFDIVLTD